MKISPETQNKILVVQMIFMVVSVIALVWFSVSLYQLNQKAADREERVQQVSVLTTRCALVELLNSLDAVSADLGIRVVIVAPDVSNIDCRHLLGQEAP